MRIDTLAQNNAVTQGAARRVWLLEHSPEHLERCRSLVMQGLAARPASAARSTLVLGAGACTEVPLADLARSSDEVVLADLDVSAMQRGRAELASPALQRRIRPVQCDLTGGISVNLRRLLRKQDWSSLVIQGSDAVFDAAAACLEQVVVPDPLQIDTLPASDFGCIVSSLVLTQLFSYPVLDVLDQIQNSAPHMLGDQERHRRYQDAVQTFRTRVILMHLRHIHSLLDRDGIAILLTDVRGFAFQVLGTNHDKSHRRYLPIVPRTYPQLVRRVFRVEEETQWDWLTDLPEGDRFGRGYEIQGSLLTSLSAGN